MLVVNNNYFNVNISGIRYTDGLLHFIPESGYGEILFYIKDITNFGTNQIEVYTYFINLCNEENIKDKIVYFYNCNNKNSIDDYTFSVSPEITVLDMKKFNLDFEDEKDNKDLEEN